MSHRSSRRRIPREGRSPAAEEFEGSWLHLAMLLVLTLKVAGVVLLFDPGLREAFALAKTQWSRAGEWVLLGLLTLALITHGSRVVRRHPLHLAVGAVVAANVIAAATAHDRFPALFGDYERYLGLFFVLDMAVTYVAGVVALRSARDWRWPVGGLMAALAVSVGYAALQRFGLDPVGWSYNVDTRPASTFGNPGPFGEFLVTAIGAAAPIAVLARGRLRAGALVAVAIAAPGVVLAGARSSLIGLAAAGVVLGLAVVLLRRPAPWKSALGALAGLGIAALILLTPPGERVLATLRGEGTRDRAILYRSLVASAAQRPLTGWGPDNVGAAYVANRQPASDASIPDFSENSAHSWVLQALVTTGAAGFIALLAMLVAQAVALFRLAPTWPVLATAVAGATAAYWASALTTVGSPVTGWIPWGLVTATAALGAAAGSERLRPHPPHGAARVLLPSVILLATLVGAAAGRDTLAADRSALLAFAAGVVQPQAALVHAAEAVARDPGRPQYWRVLGVAHYNLGRFREATDAFLEAAKRAPGQSVDWINIAKSRSQLVTQTKDLTRGGPEAALAAARTAVAIDPNSSAAHAALAETALAFGQTELGLDEILKALELYPAPDYDATLVRATAGLPLGRARDLISSRLAIHESAVLQLGLARVCLGLRDSACQVAAAQRALQLDPANPEATRLLAPPNPSP